MLPRYLGASSMANHSIGERYRARRGNFVADHKEDLELPKARMLRATSLVESYGSWGGFRISICVILTGLSALKLRPLQVVP